MQSVILPDNYQTLACAAVVFVLCAFALPAGAADVLPGSVPVINDPQDKALESAPAEFYKAGPHHELECSRCHRNTGDGAGTGEFVAADTIRLCRDCHQIEHLHPVGLTLPRKTHDKKDFILPLDTGILEGQIVCQTCHVIHQKKHNHYLLRGENGTYPGVRNSLCFSCHADHFAGKIPHTAQPTRCGYCHIEKPQKKESGPAAPDLLMQAACNLCHPNYPSSHFTDSNPFIDMIIRERAEQAGIFLADNQEEVCTTCHDPHAEKTGKNNLRSDYLELCRDSRSLNPHWNDYLCLSCHLEQPVKGNAPLRENGDKNLVCNRCHHSEYAQPDIHPVDVVPSEHIRVPADMPLEDKKLTCETCHDSCLQMGSRRMSYMRKTNPNFLRKIQVTRNTYCFLCHLEEAYKRLNPHKQLTEQGEIVEETCLFCHASIPDVRFIGPEKVSFIIHNPDEYCVGCHHGFTDNHPAGVNHLVEPSDKIMAAIQTSVERVGVELPLFNKKIVCATCHNPHEEGVIKISAAATGAERENKLRLMPGRRQCTGCHWDK
ncbi:MAG: cytochrome c3 family protein [Desulfobulbaceae bacterium]|nr:cytochrome c3 family protein [Desulfobulbaceae bacterium]